MPLNATVALIARIAASAAASAAAITTPVRTDNQGAGDQKLGAGKRALLSILRGSSEVAGTMAGPLGTLAIYGVDLPNPLAADPLGNAFANGGVAAVPSTQVLTPDGVITQFQTVIPYAAFSNNNWIVETDGFKLTGTVTVVAGVVTGAGTDFDPEVDVGDVLVLGGKIVTVTARTSDTAAVVTPAIDAAALSTGVNVTRTKRIKTYTAGPAGPLQFEVTNVGGFARIDFAVAPPTALPTGVTSIPGAQAQGVAVFKVTPVEVLASGTHADERIGIRSRTVLWVNYIGDGGDDFNSAVVTLEPIGQ